MVKNKSITEFLSDEYKDFAMYTIENRAIPSVIDGLKPSQRKVIHVSNEIWKTGNEKALKVFQLAGKVASDAFYHHGNCLDINTNILLDNGTFISLNEWVNKYPYSKFKVICYDEKSKKFTTSIGHTPRVGSITNIEFEIEMEDLSLVKCTENHPFLTKRGWIKANNLLEQDEILSRVNIKKYIKINYIKKNILNEPKKFYDITVDKYHNFIINEKSMLVTHNSSLENTIITMAQSFKNNAPLLDEDGQFGSLRSPQAGAPRYIGAKLSKNFRLIYKDFNLLEYKQEEGEKIEPFFFLPIIPTVLLNGSSGIAVGFYSNILNRKISDIILSCKKVILGKEQSIIKPYLNNFNGKFINDADNSKKWYIRGIYEKVNTTTLKITELPPSMTYEKYEELLDKLIDDKVIISYDDNCKDSINYTIKISRSVLDKMDEQDIIKTFKLEESVTEVFSTLDENGKLKVFENAVDIIEYFVNFRMNYYIKRKDKSLESLNRELKMLSNKGRFIKAILDNKLKVNNVSKSDIILNIEKMKFDKVDESYDYLLRMPIYSLTKEVFEKIKSDFSLKKEEIKTLENTDPKDMYLEDLDTLNKSIR